MENLDPKDQEMFEFGGIFDMKPEDFEEQNEVSQYNQDFYSPRLDLDTVKNGVYSARIRFVPNVFCGKERRDKIKKFIYYLPDPDNVGKKYYIDAPCNDPNAKDIVTNAYMMFCYDKSKIYDREVPIQISHACKTLKRNTYWYSLVQVMMDAQQPDTQNTVKIFRFGRSVNDKIDQLIKGDPSVGRLPVVPFDPFKGKDFLLKITKGVNDTGQEIANYDSSFFDDGIISMSLDGGETRVQMNNDGKLSIFTYLKEKSPKLDQIEFKPLTAQEEDKLIRTVRMVINNDYYFNKVYQYTYGKPYQPAVSTESVAGTGQFAPAPQPSVAPQVVAPAPQPSVAPQVHQQSNQPAVSTSASKFRSLRQEIADEQPSVHQPAEQPKPKIDAAPAPNPDISEMESGDIEALMSGDISCINDIE